MKCSNCNAELVDKAKYCHNCGESIVDDQDLILDFRRGCYGYVNKKGTPIIRYQYCNAWSFKNGLAIVAWCPFEDAEYYESAVRQGCVQYFVINTRGEWVLACGSTYPQLHILNDNVIEIELGNKRYNQNGEIIMEEGSRDSYAYTSDFYKGVALVAASSEVFDKDGISPSIYSEWKVINTKKEVLKELDYNIIPPERFRRNDDQNYWIINLNGRFSWDYISGSFYLEGGLFGYINRLGEEVIPLIYKYATPFQEDYAAVLTELDVWIFIDRQGQRISKRVYDKVKGFKDGMAAVLNYRKWGYINNEGIEIIPIEYTDVLSFSESLAGVRLDNAWGYIDKNGEIVIKFIYDEVSDFYDSIARVKKGSKYHIINKKGERLSKEYDEISFGMNGIAKVFIRDSGYGYIDVKKGEVIPCIYEEINSYRDKIRAKYGNKCGIIDSNNKVIIPFEYDAPFIFRSGYSWVKKNNKWGYINSQGAIVCQFEYDDIYNPITGEMLYPLHLRDYIIDYDERPGYYESSDNAAYSSSDFTWGVYKNDKWGNVNIKGEEIVPCVYDKIIKWLTDQTLEVVFKNGKCGVSKIEGNSVNEIIPCEYDECLLNAEEKYVIAYQGGKCGIIDFDSQELIPFMYDSIDFIFPEFLVVSRDHKDGIIDWNNNILLSCQYKIYYNEGRVPDYCPRVPWELSQILEISDKYIWVWNSEGKCGTIDWDGKEIIPCIYDYIYHSYDSSEHSYAHVRLQGRDIDIDCYGNEIIYASKDETGEDFPTHIKSDEKKLYLFFDTETTGVPKNYQAPITDLNNWPRLVQLAWILCDENGNQRASYNQIIKPNGFNIPTDASNIHKITTEIALTKGVGLEDVLMRFVEVAQSADIIIGHNVDFDIKIVGAELLRIGNNFKVGNKPSICTMLESVNYCAIPSERDWGDPYKWPKLQELHKKLFGCEFANAHDAMTDIYATKQCFFELVRRDIISKPQ